MEAPNADEAPAMHALFPNYSKPEEKLQICIFYKNSPAVFAINISHFRKKTGLPLAALSAYVVTNYTIAAVMIAIL